MRLPHGWRARYWAAPCGRCALFSACTGAGAVDDQQHDGTWSRLHAAYYPPGGDCPGGAPCSVFSATRDARQRVLAGSAFSAGLFGITEPAIYGLTLPLRRPFIFGCVAGAIGGAITAFSNSYAYLSFGLPNIFFPAQMIPPGGIDAAKPGRAYRQWAWLSCSPAC